MLKLFVKGVSKMETAEKPGELKGFEKLHKKAIFYLFEELEALFEQSELK